MLWENSLEKASEEYIDAVYYHQMYSSEACWKNHPKVVTSELGKLSSESTKYYAIKENIMIWVKGFALIGVNIHGLRMVTNTPYLEWLNSSDTS